MNSRVANLHNRLASLCNCLPEFHFAHFRIYPSHFSCDLFETFLGQCHFLTIIFLFRFLRSIYWYRSRLFSRNHVPFLSCVPRSPWSHRHGGASFARFSLLCPQRSLPNSISFSILLLQLFRVATILSGNLKGSLLEL